MIEFKCYGKENNKKICWNGSISVISSVAYCIHIDVDLFKDVDLTKSALSTISPNYEDWFKINDDDFNRLKNNELVIIESITGNQIYISKSLFGNIKKTEAIYHTVIQHNDSDEVVLFKQVESGYSIYHIIRFLNMI